MTLTKGHISNVKVTVHKIPKICVRAITPHCHIGSWQYFTQLLSMTKVCHDLDPRSYLQAQGHSAHITKTCLELNSSLLCLFLKINHTIVSRPWLRVFWQGQGHSLNMATFFTDYNLSQVTWMGWYFTQLLSMTQGLLQGVFVPLARFSYLHLLTSCSTDFDKLWLDACWFIDKGVCPLTGRVIIPSQQHWRRYKHLLTSKLYFSLPSILGKWVAKHYGGIVMRLFVWVHMYACQPCFLLARCRLVFFQSLSNLTHKLFKMKGETQLNLGHRISQFWHCVWSLVDTTVFVQSLSNFVNKFLMMRGGTLSIWTKVKINFGPPARGCHALHFF